MLPKRIETKRLILRPFTEADQDDLYEFLSQLEHDEFEGYPGIFRRRKSDILSTRIFSGRGMRWKP